MPPSNTHEMTPSLQKLQREKTKIEKEIRDRVIAYVAAAFGLVVGLAWNEAVKSLIEYFLPLGGNTIFAKFLYAAILTFIAVIGSVYAIRLLKQNE